MSRLAAVCVGLLMPACDESAVTPRSPPAPAPVIPQGHTTALTPQRSSGATLVAEPCHGGYCIDDTRFAFAFAVQVDRHVTEPWVAASFYNGLQRCAGSGFPTVLQTIEPLPANPPTTFMVSGLALS